MTTQISEDILPIPTKQLQLKSLMAFMSELGYVYTNYSAYGSSYFVSNRPYLNKGRNIISFSNAVKLHNGVYLDMWQTQYGSPRMQDGWTFDNYSLTRAFASRIVDTVKLQYTRKTKSIICQSDWVSFVDPSYKSLFLEEDRSKHLNLNTCAQRFGG